MLSIITPVFNGARFIDKNIQSILKLTIPFEHIIIDGGSTDDTLDILQKYPHIKLLHQKEQTGMYGAIHLGFVAAKYDYLTWINCDDIMITENFVFAILLMKRKNIDFLYGDGIFYWFRDNKYTLHKANPFGRYFLLKGIMPFIQPSSIYKKSLYETTLLDYNKFKICGDLDLFMRMALLPVRFFYCRKPLSIFLKYGESFGDRSHNIYLVERNELLNSPNKIDRILFKLSRLF